MTEHLYGYANSKSTTEKISQEVKIEVKDPCFAVVPEYLATAKAVFAKRQPVQARCLRESHHHDAKETELGSSKDRSCPAVQWR